MDSQGRARLTSFIILIIGVLIFLIGMFLYGTSGPSTDYEGGVLSWVLIVVGIIVIFLSAFSMSIGNYKTKTYVQV